MPVGEQGRRTIGHRPARNRRQRGGRGDRGQRDGDERDGRGALLQATVGYWQGMAMISNQG